MDGSKQLELVRAVARVLFGAMWDDLSEEDMQEARSHPIVEIGHEMGKTDEQIIALLVKFLEAKEGSS